MYLKSFSSSPWTAAVTSSSIFQNGMELQRQNLQDHGLPIDLVNKISEADAATNINLIATISDGTQKLAVKQAFAWSLRDIWILCTCMAACGIVAGALVTKKELTRKHTETRTGIKKLDIAATTHDDQEDATTPTTKEEVSLEDSILGSGVL